MVELPGWSLLVFLGLGAVLMLAGIFLFLRAAFRVHWAWGVGCIFFLPSLVFLAMYWQDVKRAVLLWVGGLLLVAAGLFCPLKFDVRTWSPAKIAAVFRSNAPAANASVSAPVAASSAAVGAGSVIDDLYDKKKSSVWVTCEGTVVRVLFDGSIGGKTQRFVVRVSDRRSVTVLHDVTRAPRLPDPEVGETIRFCGEYTWTKMGGEICRTYRDPTGRSSGWVEYRGMRYQ